MILLAEMTGSDYTDGIESVGPVTALEILADFPGNGLEPLRLFRDWWDRHQKDFNLPPGTKLREKLVRLRLPNGKEFAWFSGAWLINYATLEWLIL